jgi:uncharacterized peroxidase-related enzyme
MAHIDLGIDENQFPGITGLMRYRPETARPLQALADALLHADHPTLSRGERELIAAYVSSLNECTFCAASHSAFAAEQLDGGMPLVQDVCARSDLAVLNPRMRALLAVAAAVQRGGGEMDAGLAGAARAAGATDLDIHDTVLISAAFCMFNRYVDGLATALPPDPAVYAEHARGIAEHGYR